MRRRRPAPTRPLGPRPAPHVPPGKRAALYLRVSTERQTTANQLPELERIAAARGLTIVVRYEETESAVKHRPEFDRMLAEAHRGDFEYVLVWALDRFGRSALANLQAVFELDKKGCVVISARESWLEMDGPIRQLLIYIISWVAEQERSRLIERTRAGMTRARSQGKSIGRPRAHVNESVARGLAADGMSQRAIAKQLGVSQASVSRVLGPPGDAKGASLEVVAKSAKSRPRSK